MRVKIDMAMPHTDIELPQSMYQVFELDTEPVDVFKSPNYYVNERSCFWTVYWQQFVEVAPLMQAAFIYSVNSNDKLTKIGRFWLYDDVFLFNYYDTMGYPSWVQKQFAQKFLGKKGLTPRYRSVNGLYLKGGFGWM